MPAVEGQLGVEVAVVVPRGVEEVDEAHAALDQPAGEQAVGGERAELPWPAAAVRLDRRVVAVDAVRVAASAWVSPAKSISSGAADCMRKASS